MAQPLHHQVHLTLRTPGRGLVEFTSEFEAAVRASGVETGIATAFCRHTSASLIIQENADPTAARDLMAWFDRTFPDGDPRHTHDLEGPDDMPAHLRAAVTRSSESIPVSGGRSALGTWQGLYLFEHRLRPHERTVVVHVHGTA